MVLSFERKQSCQSMLHVDFEAQVEIHRHCIGSSLWDMFESSQWPYPLAFFSRMFGHNGWDQRGHERIG